MINNNETGCKMLSLRQTAAFFKKNNNFIILTHASPDGDTLGAAFALYYGLKALGKTAQVICPDEIPQKYGYFVCETDAVSAQNAKIVAVDVADYRLLGSLSEEYGNKVDLNIDHHISNVRYAKSLYLDADSSAACEIIFELLSFMRIKLSNVAARAIYTGIATDTGCFKYSNVTAKTHLTAAKLYKYNIDAAEINRIMFDTKSKKLLELERMVLDTAEYHFDSRCIILSVTSEMQQKTGCSGTDLEGIAVISRSVEGINVGVTIKQTAEKEFKVSIRTYEPLDASEICKKLGGGGHKAAAGVTLNGTLEEVKSMLLEAVKQAMEETNAGSYSDK